MNFEALLKLAREKADEKSKLLHPPSVARSELRRKLVVQHYLEFISPIIVEEALQE